MPPTEALRQRAVDALSEAFAQDLISVEEFERRVELAHRADSMEALRKLLDDLPRPEQLPSRQEARSLAETGDPRGEIEAHGPRPMATHVPEQTVVLGLLGGGVRRGAWHPARYNYAIGVLGGAELDFRDCAMPPVTDVRAFAVMGGVEIIVPPDVIVETSGVGILGGFEHISPEPGAPRNAPVLRVSGLALMGGVEVRVRYPGESERDAKRRRKLERREQKRLPGGGA
ncbi:MAG: DUF1707 and DUF2154 domain-containing protein [Gemmatimonadales bacterium]|jgi:hypothetical protein|nr:MAG: DUF1707 and DUF2154 domain-containing protein [Gemmatimonadales bacterium]